MGTAVFFGNRGRLLRMERGVMERIGIRVEGPVLSGEMSVRDAQEWSVRQGAPLAVRPDLPEGLRRGEFSALGSKSGK